MEKKDIIKNIMNSSMTNENCRTTNIVNQIKYSFIFRLLAIGFNFLLIPVTIKYLGTEQYGIWMTIVTIMSWITFMDFGLGNGVRNKIAEALAENRRDEIQQYISTTYVALGVIIGVLWVVLLLISNFINWSWVFNTNVIQEQSLRMMFLTVSFLLSLNFVISLINQIVNAYQRSSITIFNQLIANGVALLLTILAVKFTSQNILLISTIYCGSLVLSNIFISWYFFKCQPETIPYFNKFSCSKLIELRGLSINFLILQLGAIIFMAKDNIIITQILGPQHVPAYSVVFRIFGLLIMLHAMLLTPIWSAFTEAYTKGDFNWIKRTMGKMNFFVILSLFGVLFLGLISPYIIRNWIELEIELTIIVLMAIFTILWIWINNFVYFLNGIGTLRLSVFNAMINIFINIPLAIYFSSKYGVGGVLIANILCMIPYCILAPLQYYVIINKIQFINNKVLNELFYK